ncbi:hypothetical protein V6N13_135833 [Hibiscus sabdariffa]
MFYPTLMEKLYGDVMSVGETVEHLMPDCVFVQQLMRKLKLTIAFIQVVVWYSRNKLVRGGIKPVVDESVSFIVAFIHEQDNLGRVFTNPSATRESFWQAPPESMVKFNFDSAFNSSSQSATTGW